MRKNKTLNLNIIVALPFDKFFMVMVTAIRRDL